MYTIMQCSVLELYDLSMKYCIKSKYFILDILNVYSINYVFVLFLWFHLKFKYKYDFIMSMHWKRLLFEIKCSYNFCGILIGSH